MNETVLSQLDYLKTCKGIKGSPLEHLGQSVYSRIHSILNDSNKTITHLYIPKGSPERAKQLEADFKQKFGAAIDPHLLSFYHCFDGFEFRYINPKKAWDELKEEVDVDWGDLGVEPDDLSYEDLNDEAYEDVKDDFYYLAGLSLDNDDNFQRLSNPANADDFMFYDENIEVEDYGVKTLIPPADFLLSEANKVQYTDDTMYFFNFYSSFRQILLGKRANNIAFFSAEDGQASITQDKETIHTHLKKYLIR